SQPGSSGCWSPPFDGSEISAPGATGVSWAAAGRANARTASSGSQSRLIGGPLGERARGCGRAVTRRWVLASQRRKHGAGEEVVRGPAAAARARPDTPSGEQSECVVGRALGRQAPGVAEPAEPVPLAADEAVRRRADPVAQLLVVLEG